MIETLLVLYACGAAITGAISLIASLQDDDLSTRERVWYPIIVALTWPYFWYLKASGR